MAMPITMTSSNNDSDKTSTKRFRCRHQNNNTPIIASFSLFFVVFIASIAIHIAHVESFAFSHPHPSFHGQGRFAPTFPNTKSSSSSPCHSKSESESSSSTTTKNTRKSSVRLFGAESDMEELQRAARDPKAFEAYVLRKSKSKSKSQQQKKSQEDLSSANANNNNNANRGAVGLESGLTSEEASTSEEEAPPKVIKYVPIEQWDEERSKDADNMSWEEKVQFEGLKHGNRYRQNQILNHHLR